MHRIRRSREVSGLTWVLAMVLVFAASSAAWSGDWPRYRGPNRDGISEETEWNARFSAEGPRVLWEAHLGKGYAAVSVAGGRLFAMGHKGDEETLYCLDPVTGKTFWQRSYPAELVNNLHEGGPSATPTVDGGTVYVLSKDGQLRGYSVESGDELWMRDLKKVSGMKTPGWGFTCSPLVDGEKLIVDAGTTVAFDKKTGEVIWKSKKYKPAYSSPDLFELDGRAYLAVLNAYGLVILNPSDGTEVAKHRWKTSWNINAAMPIVHGERIFISSGYGKGCTLLKFDGGELEKVYQNRDMRNQMNPSVLIDGYLYGIDGNTGRSADVTLTCMDFETGKVMWREGGFGCGSVVGAGGRLIVLGEKGELVTAEASPQGFKAIARAQVLSNTCWTVPVLSQGKLYCRDAKGHLVCLDVSE